MNSKWRVYVRKFPKGSRMPKFPEVQTSQITIDLINKFNEKEVNVIEIERTTQGIGITCLSDKIKIIPFSPNRIVIVPMGIIV